MPGGTLGKTRGLVWGGGGGSGGGGDQRAHRCPTIMPDGQKVLSSTLQVRAFRWKTWLFRRFRRMTFCKPRTHQLPLTQSPPKIDERFYRPVIAKFR